MIRFHLDEQINHDVARGLRLRGIDVTTTTDANLLHASDEQQLKFALSERRVLVTHDPDFLALAHEGAAHAGIVFCPMGARRVGQLVRFLCLLHDCLTEEEMAGRTEFC